ncbi:3-hydroxyanthranilate 3,4-dioxygenase [Oryzias melastigma]|uniref:3-hydroxyanthranilate 3,4-dioxygenase n=1 Tax=Oryzias melastigma TaxID=30732 RepID=A0A834BS19_ORYME|nr:3-hydroxyanthranilate 3,4-dioxygenase [Oryzias melastigma]
MSNQPPLVNVKTWITENQKAFLPPVCNKLMHFSQLLIMFVGGPNTRKDYHIEEGEELFYQLKGDMCLKVIENGKHKDIHIKEGEIFLLPARIPHSPQREADTVGLVVERRRLLNETDCLRYYVNNTTDILFERWFYCENLGTQLVPIIKEYDSFTFILHINFPKHACFFNAIILAESISPCRFMASNQFQTGKPDPNEVFREPPFQLNTMNVMTPFSFKDWLERQRPSLSSGFPVDMFGAQFETEVMVFGPGLTETAVRQTDVWIWQLEGQSRVTMAEQEFSLSAGDSLLIPEQSQYQWQREDGTVALFIVQNPERKRS